MTLLLIAVAMLESDPLVAAMIAGATIGSGAARTKAGAEVVKEASKDAYSTQKELLVGGAGRGRAGSGSELRERTDRARRRDQIHFA